MPVAFQADVCQTANVLEPDAPRDCLNFFLHEENGSDYETIRVQDGNIRPISASLTGTIELATTGEWSTLVAVSVARKAIGLTVISAGMFLLWRLLAHSAAGVIFSARAVRYVRGIGWLLIAGSVVDATLGLFATTSGYSIEIFGGGPHLTSISNGDIDLPQLLFGGLTLLLAEVFRHGADVETEQRLTI